MADYVAPSLRFDDTNSCVVITTNHSVFGRRGSFSCLIVSARSVIVLPLNDMVQTRLLSYETALTMHPFCVMSTLLGSTDIGQRESTL